MVWLIFIKFKLLPWTTPWKIGVAIFPVVAIAIVILLLNIFAPTTTDVRVVKYVVPIVSGVRGRVLEVPVENNRPVKKGDVLFKIDPVPYETAIHSLEADCSRTRRGSEAEQAKLSEMQARLPDAGLASVQLNEQLHQATGQIASLQASLALATEARRAEHGARRRRCRAIASTWSRRRPTSSELTAQIAAARAAEQQVREKLSGRVNGDLATIARSEGADRDGAGAGEGGAGAGGDDARQDRERPLRLTQTTVIAPGNGTMVNVMLRPGYFVGGVAFSEVMTFVDTEYQVFALFNQNELHQVEPGNEAEITLDTYPGHVIKAHVDSVIWAQSQGQIDANGNLPQTTFNPPPGQFPVKLVVSKEDNPLFLAAGARGAAAIYTEHLSLIHIIRKVLIRTASYLDYIIIKHSISLH